MKPVFSEPSNLRRVAVFLDDTPLNLPDGANLAAALLAAGVGVFRQTPVSGAPRGPFCMMGACFDCLVEIEGETRQACLTEVTEGMRISRLNSLGHDDASV